MRRRSPIYNQNHLKSLGWVTVGWLIVTDEIDGNGNLPKFNPGDRVFVLPNKMNATVIRQRKSYDGPDYWFWGNVELLYDDGVRGICNNWQIEHVAT